MNKILENKVRCTLCGDVIVSKHRHDFQTCSCGRVSVDGGTDYLSRTFHSMTDFEELSTYVKDGVKALDTI